MKNKTILGLTMAFVMGALVVTPLFAQYISDIPIDSTNTSKVISKILIEDMIRYQNMPEINKTGKDGLTPLMRAITAGDLAQVNILLEDKDIDIDIESDSGNTALCWAIFYCKKDIVEILAEHGANLNKNCFYFDQYLRQQYDTPLVTAYEFAYNSPKYDDYKEIVTTLIKHNANLNIINYGKSALTCAIYDNDLNMVQMMVEHGADPNKPINHNGDTALTKAYNRPDIVKFFEDYNKN